MIKKVNLFVIIIITITTLELLASQTFYVPFIGKVKKLIDSDNKETKFFVPVVTDEVTKNRIASAHMVHKGKIQKYLNWLKTEPDPDVRRHYLFQISNAYGEEAKWVINELIPMLEKEPDEYVRREYLSCLSSLATKGELNDNEILKILDVIRNRIEKDPAYDVKVHAVNILSWYGDDSKVSIIKEIIDKNISIVPNVLHCIPSTLQRINSEVAKAILINLKYHSDDTLRMNAVISLYQLGLISKSEVITVAELIAKSSVDTKARMKAILLLGEFVDSNPEIKNRMEGIYKEEKNKNIKRILFKILREHEVEKSE